MLMGCSTKMVKTQNGEFDKSTVPSIFAEKKCYQTAFITDEAVGVGILTTLVIGVPIVVPTTENICNVTAFDVLPKITEMALKMNCMVEAVIITDNRELTGSFVRVNPIYKEKDITGLNIYFTYDNPPDVIEITEMNVEYKWADNGKFVLVRENISSDESKRLENKYKDIMYKRK
jgi:hypothetical protein